MVSACSGSRRAALLLAVSALGAFSALGCGSSNADSPAPSGTSSGAGTGGASAGTAGASAGTSSGGGASGNGNAGGASANGGSGAGTTGTAGATSGGTSGSAGSAGASGSAGAVGGSAGKGGSGGGAGSPSAFITWPGQNNVAIIDNKNEFAVNTTADTGTLSSDGTNVSGLFYEPTGGGDVIWAVQNGPPRVYRLLKSGSLWVPDTANNWADGHVIHYVDGGTGQPDSEGITKAAFGSNFVYVSTERDNTHNTVSLLKVLQIDDTITTRDVTATREWDLSPDFMLPTADANLGLEAIAWVPDSYLTASGLFDEAKQSTYDPANYANHAGGIFFVGLEANGMIYGYALNHTDSSFTRVAAIASGNPAIMDLAFDRDSNYLWAVCDNGCNGRTNVLDIDTGAASPTKGHFVIKQGFERPSTMANFNNEGFTIAAPESAVCSAGFKSVFYADDSNDSGHALRSDSIPCGKFLN